MTLVVLVIGAFAGGRVGLAELRGDIPPSKLESSLMRLAVHASVRREKTPMSPMR